MKITVYTITECAFSKQEKEYLAGHGLQFEEKNLESNREYLAEMLTVGNNFAGTPVTKVEKDDKSVVVLKGFTKDEFDKTFGFAQEEVLADAPAAPQVTEQAVAQPVPEVPVAAAPPAPEPVAAPVVPPPEVSVAPAAPAAPEPVAAPVTADPAMQSVLNNLEQQAQAPAATPPMPAAPAAPGTPTIPDPQF